MDPALILYTVCYSKERVCCGTVHSASRGFSVPILRDICLGLVGVILVAYAAMAAMDVMHRLRLPAGWSGRS